MNNKYTITAGSPLLRAGITITTEVSEQYVVPAARTLMTLVRTLNGETNESDAEKLRHALKHTEEQLKKEIARPRGATLAEARMPKKPPTTVRIMPKGHRYDPFYAAAQERPEMRPEMPMTERYHREVARRRRENKARFTVEPYDPPRPKGAP